MKALRFFTRLSIVLILFAGCFSCKPKEPETPKDPELTVDPKTTSEDDEERTKCLYVNTFAYNAMAEWYLWIDEPEVVRGIKTWMTTDEPIDKVKAIRYSADRWTTLTDNYKGFTETMQGVETTYGYDAYFVYADDVSQDVFAIVSFVYADSPAAEVGLKRGDVIYKVNGKNITADLNGSVDVKDLYYSSSCTVDLLDGRNLSLTARKMYEDPVLIHKVMTVGSRKVGYLFYVQFTPASIPDLIDVCKEFKEARVDDVILDLRYNGGGLVETEEAFASMLAPEDEVKGGSLYEKEVYNAEIAKVLSAKYQNHYFRTSFTYTDENKVSHTYSTKDANVGESHIYALVSSGTASASESLLVGLSPYVEVTIIGKKTHGKFCSGLPLGAVEWYEDNYEYFSSENRAKYKDYAKYADNWGIYVMVSRYADKDGNTPCMPNGFVPKYDVKDNPLDSHQLGDPEETMLAVALSLISGTEIPQTKAAKEDLRRLEPSMRSPVFGLRVLDELPSPRHQIKELEK